MAKTSIRVKVSPRKSKGGTIIAKQVVRFKKNAKARGEPIYQTKAQMNVHLNGK